jgi:xanthine/CO dehydrogenase XdhC/CoxF family maturation factor
MAMTLSRLLPLFEREVAAGRPLILATVARTEGPTYTKAGALMIIARDGEYAGLLSGGCLEGDLRGHADKVFHNGEARLVHYDMRGPDEWLLGLGSGCEGAMDIVLQRLDSTNDWQPLARLARAWKGQRSERFSITIPGGDEELTFDQAAPTRLLMLGAGPDVLPVVQQAQFLGWQVTVRDHRGAYAQPERFPNAQVVCARPEAVAAGDLEDFAAAVVMTHHYATDLAWLRLLADAPIPYVGLLGPPVRRDRLLADLGAPAARLHDRLHAPVGLNIGATSPEAIALSVIAEIHTDLAARSRLRGHGRVVEAASAPT